MTNLDENEIIRVFTKKLGLEQLDDVAQLQKGIILKGDMLVASTDVPNAMKAWQVARKSVVSCVSDLAAKGIKPYAAIISIGIPKKYKMPYIKGLAKGFAKASSEFGVSIVGGDTNEACDLVIDCSMIGFALHRVPTRSGAQPGDMVVISGKFGSAPAGLAIIMRKAIPPSKLFKKQAIESVFNPRPRQHFGLALAKYFSSSIDSSDGLAISLYELAKQASVDILIGRIPAIDMLQMFALKNNLNVEDLVFYGGEEYEIVATIPQVKLDRAILAAKRAGVVLHVIGEVKKGSGRVFVRNRLLERKGHRHFHRQ
jgi:thiamine-monophosphate kinase